MKTEATFSRVKWSLPLIMALILLRVGFTGAVGLANEQMFHKAECEEATCAEARLANEGKVSPRDKDWWLPLMRPAHSDRVDALRWATALVPWSRHWIGDEVRERYSDKCGTKVAEQISIPLPQQVPCRRHLPPYPSTPKRVVQAFVKEGFAVKSTQELRELRDTGDINKRLQYYTEPFSPGYDCYDITVGYEVEAIEEEANEARVKVAYRNVGAICPESLDLAKEKEEVIVYHLMKTHGLWRIDFPYGPPHISVVTAIRLAEARTFDSPEAKHRIRKNIVTLKKFLENSPNERRETER